MLVCKKKDCVVRRKSKANNKIRINDSLKASPIDILRQIVSTHDAKSVNSVIRADSIRSCGAQEHINLIECWGVSVECVLNYNIMDTSGSESATEYLEQVLDNDLVT